MTDIIKLSIKINIEADANIYADIRYRQSNGKKPLILLLHGFMAWKDWGFFPYTAEKLAEAGAISINFSTSHCGVMPGNEFITETSKFASNTISNEITDTEALIENFISGKISAPALQNWSGDIYLIGHSRGGAIALIIAGKDSRIGKVVSWSGIDRFVRYPQRQLDKFKQIGYFEFDYSPSGKKLRINKSYLDDYIANLDSYAPKNCVPRLNIPLMFIHGKQDMTVPYTESEGLSNLALNGTFHLIENGGHTFGISNPFKETTKAFEEVLNTTISFLRL